MYAMPEDLAKLGQLYLNKGRWNVNGETRQLLSEAWVEEAATRQTGNETKGYGFQMWVNQETGFPVMNGMFGQYIALVPLSICALFLLPAAPTACRNPPPTA